MQKIINIAPDYLYTTIQSKLRRSRPLLTVLTWELRSRLMRRSSKVLIVLMILFSGAITWLQLFDGGVAFDVRFPLFDIVQALSSLLWLMLMLTPIIVADAVVRDYKQRIHELVMTTSIPTWAYVWGRYLAGLCICYLLALPMLIVLIVATLFWGIIVQSSTAYLIPNPVEVVVFWALIVPPAMFLVGSVSFSLSTLLPQLSGYLKLFLFLIWVSFCQVLAANASGYEQHIQLASALNHHVPDLYPWLLPFLVNLGLGIACVGLAAVLFRRFSNVLN